MEAIMAECLNTLMKQYHNRQHPLAHGSRYQLVVMVILLAQDSDKHINELAPSSFHLSFIDGDESYMVQNVGK